VRWFFGLSHSIWYSLKESKKIFIRIIIFGDIHTFTSLGVFGEYAKNLFASSPLTHKSFPRILRIRLNTFRAYGDDFYTASNLDLTKSPSTHKYFPRILRRILSAHSPWVFKYFPRNLRGRRKNEDYA
jgi:hypothetical protein